MTQTPPVAPVATEAATHAHATVRPLPVRPLRRVAVLALVLTVAGIAAWEARMRALGLRGA